jgi:hypothetical protein
MRPDGRGHETERRFPDMKDLVSAGRAALRHRATWAAIVVALFAISAVTALALAGSHGPPGAARHEATATKTPSRAPTATPPASQAVRKLVRTVRPRPNGSRAAGPPTPAPAERPQPAAAPAPAPAPAQQPQPEAPPQDCYAGPHPTCVPPPPPSWMLHSSYISTPTS